MLNDENYKPNEREIRTIYVNGNLFHDFKKICAMEGSRASWKIEELIKAYIDSRPQLKKLCDDGRI